MTSNRKPTYSRFKEKFRHLVGDGTYSFLAYGVRKSRKNWNQVKSFFSQLRELSYLSRQSYPPDHDDYKFYNRYYELSEKDNLDKDFKTGIICMFDGRAYHGGITDRLRGILSTYQFAKKKGWPFYINFTSPFLLEKYLEPNSFDWRIKPDNISYSKTISFPFIIEDEPDLYSSLRMKIGLKLSKPQIHVYSNADTGRGQYKLLFNELFRPTAKLKSQVDYHLSCLGSHYEGFTFRFLQLLGDFKDWLQVTLTEKEAVDLMHRVGEEFKKLTAHIGNNEKILVTSDSKRFLNYISSIDSRVYVVPGEVKNIDLLKGEYEEAWLKTFIDQQLLMHASKVTLVRTGQMYKSGFPRFAAEIGGVDFKDHKF